MPEIEENGLRFASVGLSARKRNLKSSKLHKRRLILMADVAGLTIIEGNMEKPKVDFVVEAQIFGV